MKKIMLLVLVLAIGLTVGGCVFTGTICFNNYRTNVYDCYIDGVYQGSVGSLGYFYVYGVSLGYHDVEADYVSGGGGGIALYWDPAFSVTSGTNYWNFNQ